MSKLSAYIAAQQAEEAQSTASQQATYDELHQQTADVVNEIDTLFNLVFLEDETGNLIPEFSLEKFDPEVAGELLSVLQAAVKYLKGEDESSFKPVKQKKSRERKPRNFGKVKNVGKSAKGALGRIP